MPSTTAFALTAALTGLAVASPTEARDAKKTFSVTQVFKNNVVKAHPALVVANTYGKFAKAGAKAPQAVSKAAAAAVQKGQVTASPESYDESYLCPVTIGGQTLNLDFDTGSADLWVYSTLQPTTQQSGHSVYKPAVAAQAGYTWQISYGDGSSAGGKVYPDKVVVGSVTATKQAVEAATSVSSAFLQDTDNDGLLGLAFSTINTVSPKQQTTFFDTVKPTLAKALFAVSLKKGAPGTYDFGYIDTTKYTGAITYVNADSSQGFWGFTAGGYQIGTKAAVSTAIGSAIADTGTTLLYLPSALVTAYYKGVSGAAYSSSQSGYTFPCSTTLPNFTVTIGGTKFVVPGSYINYAPISSKTCFGGIQANTGIGFSIFGDIFLKSVYVIFDQTTSTPRLGFAKQA